MPIKDLEKQFKMKEIKTGRIGIFTKLVSTDVLRFERYEGYYDDNEKEKAIYRPLELKSLVNPRWCPISKKRRHN